jgi:hypothetical protein
MLVRCFTFLTLPVVLASAAFAAEPAVPRIEAVAGKVLVNQGKGFSVATKSMAVKSGTKIMVGQDSHAVLVFPAAGADAGCRVKLAPLSMTRVAGPEMCDAALANSGGVFENPVITPTASEAAPGGLPPAAVGLGFFTIVAGVGVASLFENNGKPISAP